MAKEVSGQGQRWTAKRRAALVRRVLKGKISVREGARKYGLPVAELKQWRHRFLLAAENALRFPPIDEEAFEDERNTEPERRIRELAALRERVSPATGASMADSTGSGSQDGEGRYRHVLESVRAIIVETDDQGRFTYVSPTISEVLGYAPEELLNRRNLQGIHEEDRAAVVELFQHALDSGQGPKLAYRARHKDGHWLWLETTLSSYRTEDGSTYTVALARDVTDLKRAEDALRESEALYRTLAENASDLIAEVDGDGRFLFISPNCSAALGEPATAYIGRTLGESGVIANVHPDDRGKLLEAFRRDIASGGEGGQIEFRYHRADGEWRWFESKAKTYRTSDGSLRAVVISRDVTERVRAQQERRDLEQRMQEAQKLESLGVMAGGIAHDFNNLLTPILGSASLAFMDLPPESPARAQLQKIQKAAHRAAALTNQMLAYAGKGSLHVDALNLTELAREMGQLLEGAVSGKAVLAYDLQPALPAIEADASQLSQVVMNLITNACEAVGECEGRIKIRTGTVDVGPGAPASICVGEELVEGTYVYFEVTDNGCGMDAETRARIFDPFFTTKFTGRGLGLAAVLGIVRGHKGAIQIESEPGRGTCFRVLFPRSARPHALGPLDLVGAEDWRMSGTVLVVDDDYGVRELAEDTLTRAGLSVLCAGDGREGIELFRRHAAEIRAVLLDRTMPGMSGEEVVGEMRRIRPDAPIVLISGYSQESVIDHFAGTALAGFLHKPFLPTTLLRKVRELLEEK